MLDLILILLSICATTFAISLTANVRSCLSNAQSLNVVSFLTSIPLLMLWLGFVFGDLIGSLTGWEHQWVLMVTLLLTGLRLLIKAFRFKAEERAFDLRNIKVLLFVSFALGMNAFIIGTGLSFGNQERSMSFLIFSIASISFAVLGLILGKKYGKYELGNKVELLSGFILCGLGIKIALQLVEVL